MFEDPTLPFDGPGLQPTNGNFVLTELVVTTTDPVPEPATLGLVMLTGLAYAAPRRRRSA